MAQPRETGRDDGYLALRPLLFSVAYRMLGSASDAEDIVQDAWFRYQGATDVREPKAYLVQVVTRLCLDQLRSARVRRETYVGPWLPEPVLTGQSTMDDPLATVERREELSLGALAILERLSPQERAVLVLYEALDYSHAEIADAVGITAVASRQQLSRARRRMAERPRRSADPAQHRRLLSAMLTAFSSGDTASLVDVLRADVVMVNDTGGEISAARRPVYGADKVSRWIAGVFRKRTPGLELGWAEVNGLPAVVTSIDGHPMYYMCVEVVDGQVAELLVVGGPTKLTYARQQLSRSG